ncbi:hypothetical protein CANARDRAFT_7136 [[Candida] arabinofermentans NRRL YB-2248]|uniref:Type 2A phosphatase activator TIP41 n=1 Tax=[Candida] arabinofermentans NRRL YB-2248 TaxID=983967 RepID=A0A1E4T1Y3_9ASCO|nr:hypothetical protein CANARDRAFT_7136 [[Candida] arabinofermentans NRRL YB-2248]
MSADNRFSSEKTTRDEDQTREPIRSSKSTLKADTPTSSSIGSVFVNSAREMHQLTTNARFPNKKPTQSILSPSFLSASSANRSSNKHTQTSSISTTTIPSFQTSLNKAATRPQSTPVVQVPAKGHTGACNNPQCSDCGAVIIPSPRATLPLQDTPSISISDWEIYTSRNPILNATEIETYESILSIPVPEMIFGNNKVEIKYLDKFHINYNSLDALKLVALNPSDLIQVSYANEWFQSRQQKHASNDEVLLEMYRPFDWTYSTNYQGTLLKGKFIRDDTMNIPLEKLKRQDPILFFDDMILYEDELGDNGISIMNIKIRAMHSCLLLLQRLFVRVDNVLIRIYDTRLYIDFETNLVVREFKRQELDYDSLLKLCTGNDPRSLMRDINWCSSELPVIDVQREYMTI